MTTTVSQHFSAIADICKDIGEPDLSRKFDLLSQTSDSELFEICEDFKALFATNFNVKIGETYVMKKDLTQHIKIEKIEPYKVVVGLYLNDRFVMRDFIYNPFDIHEYFRKSDVER